MSIIIALLLRVVIVFSLLVDPVTAKAMMAIAPVDSASAVVPLYQQEAIVEPLLHFHFSFSFLNSVAEDRLLTPKRLSHSRAASGYVTWALLTLLPLIPSLQVSAPHRHVSHRSAYIKSRANKKPTKVILNPSPGSVVQRPSGLSFGEAQKELRRRIDQYFDGLEGPLKAMGRQTMLYAHMTKILELRGNADENDPYGTMPERRLVAFDELLSKFYKTINLETLPTYIKRVNDPTLQQGLVLISVYDPKLYQALERGNILIQYFKITPGYEDVTDGLSGYTLGGLGLLYIDPSVIGHPAHAAINLVHEGVHARDFPRTSWGYYWYRVFNLWDIVRWPFTGVPLDEQSAFSEQKAFEEKVFKIRATEGVRLVYKEDRLISIAWSFFFALPLALPFVGFWFYRLKYPKPSRVVGRVRGRRFHYIPFHVINPLGESA